MNKYLYRQNCSNTLLDSQLEFQIIDIYCKDEKHKDTGENLYFIHLFGVTKQGTTVHVKICNFRPLYYIKLPKYYSNSHLKLLEREMKNNLKLNKDDDVKCNIIYRKDYSYFNNYEDEKFLKISFKNRNLIYKSKYFLQDYAQKNNFNFSSYEASLEPMLRFLHIMKIKPSGWVKCINLKKCYETKCTFDFEIDYKNISPVETNLMAPFLTASFDIECISGDKTRFPDADILEDQVIQIGTTCHIFGDENLKPLKYIATLKGCSNIPDAIIECFDTEQEMLLGWMKFMNKLDPDIITGYNIFGFDFKYLSNRAKLFKITHQFNNLSRFINFDSKLIIKNLSSSAYGFNEMSYMESPGRLLTDLMKIVQQNYNFDSYKLDDVASEFIQGKILSFNVIENETCINVKDIDDLEVGNYIKIIKNKMEKIVIDDKYKFKIIRLTKKQIFVNCIINIENKNNLTWALAKDDMDYSFIKPLQEGNDDDRALIAKYCIQDCLLCNKLIDKMKIITNNIGMSNVCFVPMNYLFFRGQGIKIFSLVSKKCRDKNYLIPDREQNMDTISFKGATVLEAKPGGHFYPIACNDFASLYPSSIISSNLSPDTLIKNIETCKIEYSTIEINETKKYNFICAEKSGEYKDEAERPRRGIIPLVLIEMLNMRKSIRKLMITEKNTLQLNILDGLQLSYKLVANSIYGQMGSSFSSIACVPVAESTTFIGRNLLQLASNEIMKLYPDAEIIYGDTDSVMVKYNVGELKNPTKEDKINAIQKSINCGKNVEKVVSAMLPYPHKLEYEKTYYPYILLSKKRYSGILYENDPTKFSKIDNKGNILKRRDNAKIAKYIYSGILDCLLFDQDIEKGYKFARKCLEDFCNEKFSEDFLIMTKAYKKTKTEPAHVKLINRVNARHETVINFNDRIKYIYTVNTDNTKKKITQGDIIETPEFIKKNKLKIDYLFYITNEIQNPVLGLLAVFENNDETIVRKKLFDKIINEQLHKNKSEKKITFFFKNF